VFADLDAEFDGRRADFHDHHGHAGAVDPGLDDAARFILRFDQSHDRDDLNGRVENLRCAGFRQTFNGIRADSITAQNADPADGKVNAPA